MSLGEDLFVKVDSFRIVDLLPPPPDADDDEDVCTSPPSNPYENTFSVLASTINTMNTTYNTKNCSDDFSLTRTFPELTIAAGEPQQEADDPASRNIYVASLPSYFTDDDLLKLFAPFGPVVSAKVMCRSHSRVCKGYGFVLYRFAEDAARAHNTMIGHVVGGNKLQVRRAHPTATKAASTQQQHQHQPQQRQQQHQHQGGAGGGRRPRPAGPGPAFPAPFPPVAQAQGQLPFAPLFDAGAYAPVARPPQQRQQQHQMNINIGGTINDGNGCPITYMVLPMQQQFFSS